MGIHQKIVRLQSPFLCQVSKYIDPFVFLHSSDQEKCSVFIFIWNHINRTALDTTAHH